MLSMVNSALADVSIRENISDTAIQRIIDDFIGATVNWQAIKSLGIIGVKVRLSLLSLLKMN